MIGRNCDAVKHGTLEPMLASFLTDGHYNGIAIGIRNIDPMIFKHLANLGLIKSVFVVRGTGNTWGFGSYFPKRLSEAALSCLEGPKKPYSTIRDAILDQLDLSSFLRWIMEFEGNFFIQRWGSRLLLVISITQYETIKDVEINNTSNRLRLSVIETKRFIEDGKITPSTLWIDYLIAKVRNLVLDKGLKHYKSYQLDLRMRRTSLAHIHYLYADCTNDARPASILESLTLENTWKRITATILDETIQVYTKRLIQPEDINMVKKIISCNIDKPLKGPYNEYIIKRLPQIYPLILNGRKERIAERTKKLNKLIKYFTYERKKSLNYLLNMLTQEESEQLQRLTATIKSLNTLIEEFSEGGTPTGRLWVIINAS